MRDELCSGHFNIKSEYLSGDQQCGSPALIVFVSFVCWQEENRHSQIAGPTSF